MLSNKVHNRPKQQKIICGEGHQVRGKAANLSADPAHPGHKLFIFCCSGPETTDRASSRHTGLFFVQVALIWPSLVKHCIVHTYIKIYYFMSYFWYLDSKCGSISLFVCTNVANIVDSEMKLFENWIFMFTLVFFVSYENVFYNLKHFGATKEEKKINLKYFFIALHVIDTSLDIQLCLQNAG